MGEIISFTIIDNYFELGGNSLKASILISEIQNRIDPEISLQSIFSNTTIKALSDYIGEKNQGKES